MKPTLIVKPFPRTNVKPKRLLEGKSRMTIAIGAYCSAGLIVAADTNVISTDGSKTQAMKVHQAVGPSGKFAFANSTEDGNAANTLAAHLRADLESNEINSLAVFEWLIADRMTQWAAAFSHPPGIQLVVAAYIDKVAIPYSNSGGGFGLYFCEPPNTVVRKFTNDDSRGYVAVGSGAPVTDPLYKTLFPMPALTQTRLMQISYLMYRAKRDSALCGGRTNAVVLTDKEDPIWVTPIDTEKAEHFGPTMDFFFTTTASGVIGQPSDEMATQFAKHLAEMIVSHGKQIRDFRFHSLTGDEIT